MDDRTETLVDLLRAAEVTWGERTALSIRAGLREDAWSYTRLWRAANAVAWYLRRDLALSPGDRVVVWAPNGPQVVACFFGAMLARLVLVPLDPFSTEAFIRRVVERTDAALVITGFTEAGLAGARVERLANLPCDDRDRAFDEQPSGDDLAEIVFTSGTTGDPKGVMLTHGNIVANVRSAGILIGQARFRLLSVLPLSHMLEQTIGLYLPLRDGATIIYPGSRQSTAIGKALRRHRIETMIVVPQVLRMLLDAIEREVQCAGQERQWRALHRVAARTPWPMRRWLFRRVHRQLGGHLSLAICGGAALPTELAAAWERMGVRVVEGYGATECAPIVAANTPQRRRHGSIGRPAPGVDVRLSAEGEIQVRGANVTSGYWRDETTTRRSFTVDGWFRTGDLAEWGPGGSLRLRGRLNDLIVLPSGLKVFPQDVERELRLEAGIADCVVVNMPVDDAPSVHAVVIPAGASAGEAAPETARRAVRAANARLAPHQRVAGFTIWKEGDFPRTNLQKVKRHEVLRALAGEAPGQPPGAPLAAATGDRFDRLARLMARLGAAGETITPESDLALDLQLDSLSRVELAVLIEEEFGVALEDGDMASVGTVAELLALVEAGATSAATAFPRWSLLPPARMVRPLLQGALLAPLHALICRPFRVEGREQLRGLPLPALLIANHSSHLDTVSILRALPWRMRGRVAVAAAADYFYRTRLLGNGATILLNTFPFSREGAVRASLDYCGELADRGWSILVYPEGTRSPTGALQPFRSGTGLLADELRLPVVPIAIEGTHALLPKGRAWPRRGPVTVRFGAPIAPPPTSDHAAATARLERAVADLRRDGVRGA